MNYNKLYSLAGKFHKVLKQGAAGQPLDPKFAPRGMPRALPSTPTTPKGSQRRWTPALSIVQSLGIPLDDKHEWQGSLLLAVGGQGHWLLTHIGKDGRPTLARVDMATGDPEEGKTYGEEWWVRVQGRVNVIAHYQDFTPSFSEGGMGEYDFHWGEGDEAVYEGLKAKESPWDYAEWQEEGKAGIPSFEAVPEKVWEQFEEN